MAVSAEYKEFIAELCAPALGDVLIKPMFGGAGVYIGEAMFGLIAGETLYLKCDDATRAAFEQEGCKPFVFRTKGGGEATMSFWELPERLLDEPDDLPEWLLMAVEAATRALVKRKK